MDFQVDIWLRGTTHATTRVVAGLVHEPAQWTDADVEAVLVAMLREMDRLGNPDTPERPVALRGFSWIVNPFEAGGVLLALEMQLGAAVAGPFDVPELALTAMVTRVMAAARAATAPPGARVH